MAPEEIGVAPPEAERLAEETGKGRPMVMPHHGLRRVRDHGLVPVQAGAQVVILSIDFNLRIEPAKQLEGVATDCEIRRRKSPFPGSPPLMTRRFLR